jgi:hypothetical protein
VPIGQAVRVLCARGDLLIVASGGVVRALDARTGAERWRRCPDERMMRA